MIWENSTKVGFGVKSPWVVAWYCPKGNEPKVGDTGSTDAYKKNVRKTCIENGMNICYNKFALKAHNDKRLLHKDTPPMETNVEAAKAIQAILD